METYKEPKMWGVSFSAKGKRTRCGYSGHGGCTADNGLALSTLFRENFCANISVKLKNTYYILMSKMAACHRVVTF